MQTKAFLTILIIGLAVLTACGEKHTDAVSDLSAVPVSVISAQYQSISTTLEVPGTVQPRKRIALASQINGFVKEMRVRAGDRVKSGQVLATLDSRDAANQQAAAESAVREAQAALSEAGRAYQAAVEMQRAAKSALNLANQTYTRYQKLFESRSVSPQEMDEIRTRRDGAQAEFSSREAMVAAAEDRIQQVEARISQAKAQAGRADVLMSYTRIDAPESGVVVERSADSGTAIFPGSPLLVMETTGKPQVLASIPTEYSGHLKIGMAIRLRQSDSTPFMEGKLSEIVPQSNPATHSIQFKVDLPSDAAVVHGQYMKLEVPTGTRDALLIARSAVRESGQLIGLYVVENESRASFRLVKTSPYDAEKLEILSGVGQGEKIILQPDDRITDGMPVEIQL
ncbi:MAG: efflux RND transporter periplasmic adaptor subunit [Acidobacteria bacterium]|nr:efflux RND transporter periplasmic adaptor subunit [Acidobacteriota bacterium]